MFKGFPRECIKFFNDLKLNNNRQWFENNKDSYKQFVVTPYQEFVNEISGQMLEIDPLFEIEPKVGKAISRIYRDMRFSKEKIPYRTNTWISFKRNTKQWKESPSYYFDLSDSAITYGMGYYMAPKESMDKLRVTIEEEPEKILNFINTFNNETPFKVMGESYKKVLNKNIEAPLLDWYQKKDIYLMHAAPITEEVYSPKLADKVLNDFLKVGDFYNFLKDLR